MDISPSKINLFLFLKLPAAFWCGVRTKSISSQECTTTVTHRWINQNPFQSMYFAVQAMAAELSTGALVMNATRKGNTKISMLVANNKASFTKKATGQITFRCSDGERISDAVNKAIASGEGQTLWMKSIGTNSKGEQVAEIDFEWTIKVKSQR
jgi:Domain of unknown function (DUF4442)